VAEDIAVLDNASGGRLTTILGIGYRPSEYAAHGKDWSQRGRAHGRVRRHLAQGVDR
jgi:alkanesulfonate monooxygenase SsuD/methylene tetrahydromethanopterin reductase-like flavin-dependent oxidoreductase (luciferase family)